MKKSNLFKLGCLLASSFISINTFAVTDLSQLKFTAITFNQLPGWQASNTITSFNAFKKSCLKTLSLNPDTKVGTLAVPLTVKDWYPVCKQAVKLKPITAASTKKFFTTWFNVYAVSKKDNYQGLFTGYYLPAVAGRLHKTKLYSIPIYGRPKDLVTAKLGLFRIDLQGKKIAGRVINGKLYPYGITRKQINHGALKNKAKVLAWVKHRADRFFLQIQGSGLILLPHGKKLLLGYDGDNGQSYYPIGRWLIEQKILNKENISMQKIYQWLLANPVAGKKLMDKNQAFVFFTILPNKAPLGTQAVPLTAGYSLAVDGNIIPLGSPVWLTTTLPNAKQLEQTKPLKRLFIAQDTGGAIYGIVRADIYLGAGEQAALIAGHMKNKGRYWLLLPKDIKPNPKFL